MVNGICLNTHNSLVMIFTIATIFDIVHVISSFFAQQPGSLCAGDVEALFATGFVALHACSRGGSAFPALLFA